MLHSKQKKSLKKSLSQFKEKPLFLRGKIFKLLKKNKTIIDLPF